MTRIYIYIYIYKDSTDFINKLEDLNAKGPLPEGSLLVS